MATEPQKLTDLDTLNVLLDGVIAEDNALEDAAGVGAGDRLAASVRQALADVQAARDLAPAIERCLRAVLLEMATSAPKLRRVAIDRAAAERAAFKATSAATVPRVSKAAAQRRREWLQARAPEATTPEGVRGAR